MNPPHPTPARRARARPPTRVALRDVDLNLLVLLASLLRTRSTTASARELLRTQSAVSHALQRLRRTFDDELLVRVGKELRPTARAEQLREPLVAVLAGAESLLSRGEESLDPSMLAREFVIGGTDFFEALVLPGLMARLASEAPGVSLVMRVPGNDVERALLAREIDLAFGTRFRPVSGVVVEHETELDLVVLVRRAHPALGRARAARLSLAAYAALPHVLVAPRGAPGGAVDEALAKRGLTRRVVVRVQHFLVAAMIARDTDAVVTLPRAFAHRIVRDLSLAMVPVPVEVPPFVFHFAHALEREGDVALSWLRRITRDVFRQTLARAQR